MAEHFDLLIVGAGLSGIGAGHHFQTRFPGKKYAILEARAAIGGTWDLFRYPGVRSDSDMFTLGYSFRPWKEAKVVADGPAILEYVRETARELGIDRHIRFNQRVIEASWAEGRWSVQTQADQFTCDFLYVCSGYFDYAKGFTPELPGLERFTGRVIHPQQWPEHFDYSGSRVLIIGSGATAATLVPAMAKSAGHVTMVQRSPSYVVTIASTDPLADFMRRVLPERLAHRLIRLKNLLGALAFYEMCQRLPRFAKWLLKKNAIKQLPAGFDVEKHFTPRYNPWDQRVCFVPDGDLFNAIASGKASVETGTIATFTPTGLTLDSGKHLEAEIVVTATGLEVLALGGIVFSVDGRPITIGETVTYKGTMLAGVPNFAYCVGYTNASWTLRADLSSMFVCRVIGAMHDGGFSQCRPTASAAEVSSKPVFDLTSSYVLRSADRWPKQGEEAPWVMHHNYFYDFAETQLEVVHDDTLEFS